MRIDKTSSACDSEIERHSQPQATSQSRRRSSSNLRGGIAGPGDKGVIIRTHRETHYVTGMADKSQDLLAVLNVPQSTGVMGGGEEGREGVGRVEYRGKGLSFVLIQWNPSLRTPSK